jgi:acetolactate synthase-1/2/3 large subunit
VNGGERIAVILARAGVRHLFTLCGGHISPILVGAKSRGIRVVDVRDEANAVFAADATARLSGTIGVAAVTAGPGLTNALTPLRNALMARSPLLVLGGATATVLRGRGSLQDIDQIAAVRSHVKWAARARTCGELDALVERAVYEARSGVPGPVFVECPVDLLYEPELVRELYGVARPLERGAPLGKRVERWYLERHLRKTLRESGRAHGANADESISRRAPTPGALERVSALLAAAERPVMLVGSQAMEAPRDAAALADAVRALGVPTYLAGMARGLLGGGAPLQLRHQRKQALKEADLVMLAGTPVDFRLDYGRHIGSRARIIAVNGDAAELKRNRRPTLGVHADADLFVRALAAQRAGGTWAPWLTALRARDDARDAEISSLAAEPVSPVNPIALCRAIDARLTEQSIVVADGGDFVATASYVLRPRAPLGWLDPGVFGTLGVGAGFALGAKLHRPESEVWLLYGDGAAGFSLMEFDTFVRHGVPVIAVIGNDGSWAQIAREQVPMLHDDVGTALARSAYERVAEAFGAKGFVVDSPDAIEPALDAAREAARAGTPVLVNVMIGSTEFRKGSVSL